MVRKKYKDKKAEEGQNVVANIEDNKISLLRSEVGMPNCPWIKDGWKLSPLILPPTVSICPAVEG